jgi:proteasome lid subunit RPN8/RPN11
MQLNDTRTGMHKPQVMSITREVLKQIEDSVGRKPAETGGPLGGKREGFLVEHFYFDSSSTRSGVTYSPDDIQLNRLFRDEWNPRGINLLGFVHSHPSGIRGPSTGDLVYARRILHAIPDLEYLLLPIVQSKANVGRFNIFPYAAIRWGDDVEVVKLEMKIVDSVRTPIVTKNLASPTARTFETLKAVPADKQDPAALVRGEQSDNLQANERPGNDFVV